MGLYENPPYYLSAYGLAVKHGYKGTEEEWLEDLKGEKVLLRYQDKKLQWQHEGDEEWLDLMTAAEIRGEAFEEALAEANSAKEEAGRQATAAGASAGVAEKSAQAAKASETAAKGSASEAAGSAQAAKASETEAKAARTGAKSSETKAGKSETAALAAQKAAAQSAQEAEASKSAASASATAAGEAADRAEAVPSIVEEEVRAQLQDLVDEAGSAANAAGGYAQSAAGAEAEARRQAAAAGTSAGAAEQSRKDADAARAAAETARAEAKEHRDAAKRSEDEALKSAEKAVQYSGKPAIPQNGTWWKWDADKQAYVDTGEPANVNPCGEYDPEAVYNRMDVVRRAGSSYLALRSDLQGVLPIDGPDWMCVLERCGKSAYEQAVDAGLTATEAQFKVALAKAVTAFGDWSSGLTPEEEIDPEIVYERTRPVDWMKMPALEDTQDGEFWLLFQWLPGDTTECSFTMRASSDIKVEAGRYEDGVFTPQEKYTKDYHPSSAAAYTTVTISLDGADFGDLTSEGKVQALVRISGHLTYIELNTDYDKSVDGIINARDLTVLNLNKPSNLTYFAIVNMSDLINGISFWQHMRLRAVRGTFASVNIFSAASNILFGSCYELVAIPLDATFANYFKLHAGNYYSSVFSGCRSLRRLPEGATFASVVDGGIWDNGDSMFRDCFSLQELPAGMTLDNLVKGDGLLQNCYSIRELPSGMTFKNLVSGRNMFNSCYALRVLPSGITFESLDVGQDMFSNCFALRELPSGVTFKNLTNGQAMFYYCTSLRELPSGVTFENLITGQAMLRNCYALRELLNAYFPEVTTLQELVYGCSTLLRVTNLYAPKCSNLTDAFYRCDLLEELTFDPRMTTWDTPQDIGLAYTRLSHAAIVNLFNTLPTIETPKTITLTGTPGASQVTAEDVAIATAKGWLVAGVPTGIATGDPGGTEGPEIFSLEDRVKALEESSANKQDVQAVWDQMAAAYAEGVNEA